MSLMQLELGQNQLKMVVLLPIAILLLSLRLGFRRKLNYIIKEFQRLKIQESEQLDWHGKRMLTKLNYLIQTDAVKEHLVPVELSYEQKSYIYASEADLLNVALFGKTAKEWREVNPDKEGNLRDYANTIELAILSNLEFMNAQLIAN